MKFIHTINEYCKASKVNTKLNESLSKEELDLQQNYVDSVLATMTNGLKVKPIDNIVDNDAVLNLASKDIPSSTDDGVISMELSIVDDGTDTEISLEDLANIIETAIDAAVVADEIASDNESDHTIVVDIVPNEDDFDVDAFIDDEMNNNELQDVENEEDESTSSMLNKDNLMDIQRM